MNPPLARWLSKVCIVTGASAGIGAAIAEVLACNRLTVVGVARRMEKLEQLSKSISTKNGKFYPFAADISKESDVIKLFKWVNDNLGPVHVLVNSAGVARITTLVTGNTQLWKEILDTNVLGLCMTTREAIKNMREHNVDGHIIHINSLSGHRVPNFRANNVYPASKHAVTALTETLRQELNSIGSKIKITSISPGLVRTELYEASAIASGKPGINKAVEDMLNNAPSLDPKDLADAVLYVLSTPPHVQVHEMILKPVGEIV